MPAVRHGTGSWPGAIAIEAISYSTSQGISPGTATLTVLPQPQFPEQFGDLVISDGVGSVTIPGCRMDNLAVHTDGSGTIWNCTILDRRWRWRDLGIINGLYNQLDDRGNLIPWTIRSPTELAILCLQAMGETNYTINLPPGINYPGPNFGQAIKNVTGTNPPVSWVGTPPAQALQSLAEQYGCRVIYQLSTDSILIAPTGVGNSLPDGSIHSQGPTIKSPETPDAVGVMGSPTRYQMQLALIAVGEEWDGRYKPINDLSYAPVFQGKPQINTGTVTYDGSSAITFEVTINGVNFQVAASPGNTAAMIANGLAADIQASNDPKVKGVVVATSAFGVLTLTGAKNGVAFDVEFMISGAIAPGNDLAGVLVQNAQPDGKSWANDPPPTFANVRETDRLTVEEARKLAQKSVWKIYALSGVDVSGKGPIKVPGYTTLVRKQQVVVQQTQVDQIVPEDVDANTLDQTGKPIVVNFYAGYSKDKPAVVIGAVDYRLTESGIRIVGTSKNTPPDHQLFLPFSVFNEGPPGYEAGITFSDFVYAADNNGGPDLVEPTLKLQTAVQVRNASTNQFETFLKVVPLPGQTGLTNPKIKRYPDVQLNVSSTYDVKGNITGVSILEADPILRANYYLQGLAASFAASDALTLQYNGVVPIDLDGAIAQVSYSVGGGGATTHASRNTEHSWAIPPYPARRRAEYLPPVPRTRVSLAEDADVRPDW